MGKIAYFFTTFPKLSERFFLREVVSLKNQGIDLDIFSMLGGALISEAGPVLCMRWLDWLWLPVELLFWSLRMPSIICRLFLILVQAKYGSWTNVGENWLGLAVAIRFARRVQRSDYAIHHATWATAPGMCVYALKKLTGKPYSLEAHAYDVFRNGGDALLSLKLREAESVRSSTDATAGELRRILLTTEVLKGVEVHCIRRGLETVPKFRPQVENVPTRTFRILSVGRLIEKKGYFEQLKVFASLRDHGFLFKAFIIGEGPLFDPLLAAIEKAGLTESVTLLGRLEYALVREWYQKSDLFFFCGKISNSGDRDGFPNVIGEAMAHSLPVFSTDVSGTTEGVVHLVRGVVIDADEPNSCAGQIITCMKQRDLLDRVTREAHSWVEEEFQVNANTRKLRLALWPTL